MNSTVCFSSLIRCAACCFFFFFFSFFPPLSWIDLFVCFLVQAPHHLRPKYTNGQFGSLFPIFVPLAAAFDASPSKPILHVGKMPDEIAHVFVPPSSAQRDSSTTNTKAGIHRPIKELDSSRRFSQTNSTRPGIQEASLLYLNLIPFAGIDPPVGSFPLRNLQWLQTARVLA